MPYEFTYMWNLKNKTNKIKTNSDTEYILMIVSSEGVTGMDEKVNGLRSTNWLLQNSYGDVKYSKGIKSIIP